MAGRETRKRLKLKLGDESWKKMQADAHDASAPANVATTERVQKPRKGGRRARR